VLDAGAKAIVHCYGPTEATVFTTAVRFGASMPPCEPFGIGGPVAGTACYVLDTDRQPVPIGTDGELWIGGEAVASGYLGDAELTAARFLPDPFRAEGRMYRSGDLVRMQDDGSLIFLDRLDEQLKIRGHRVEPSAIARRLEAVAGVRQALVLAAEVGPGDRRLCAFIETSAASAGLERALRSELQQELPAALVPWRIIALPSFPLSANGKIDREALLARLTVAPPPVFDEPRYAEIADLFTAILKLAPDSVDDDFFDLGGDSLLAMRLLGRLREQFRWQGTLGDLYGDATIRGIARRLSGEMTVFEAGSL
jgi:acyl-coenzyme A synthetase/AMP-(fatty) acid ligase